MAQLKSTVVQGNLAVTDQILGNTFVKDGGSATELLAANGSVWPTLGWACVEINLGNVKYLGLRSPFVLNKRVTLNSDHISYENDTEYTSSTLYFPENKSGIIATTDDIQAYIDTAILGGSW